MLLVFMKPVSGVIDLASHSMNNIVEHRNFEQLERLFRMVRSRGYESSVERRLGVRCEVVLCTVVCRCVSVCACLCVCVCVCVGLLVYVFVCVCLCL